jgi:P-type conjugative transfer protein TrbJ
MNMRFGILKNLAAKYLVCIAVVGAGFVTSAHAGIPVIDGSNLAQNVMTAAQTAETYAKQLQQYETQLEQYETQLKNTVAPAAYIWDQAQMTINKITSVMNAVQTLRDSNGGALTAYLNQFKDANFYSNSPCFKAAGCSGSQWNAMLQNSVSGSVTSKQANDAWLHALDQQQQQLQTDSANLQSLQAGATTAVGQMQAIQSANQLSSSMSNNLLQLRAVILAQQQAEAAKRAADLDKQAQQTAGEANARSGTFSASSGQSWSLK